ncbi:hypothetical protein, partial [Bifidobacterium longum]
PVLGKERIMAIPMPIVQDIRRLDVFSQVGVSFGDPNLTKHTIHGHHRPPFTEAAHHRTASLKDATGNSMPVPTRHYSRYHLQETPLPNQIIIHFGIGESERLPDTGSMMMFVMRKHVLQRIEQSP